jgi:hypothetical protein
VIVLSEMPESLASVGVTYIDDRFTDLLFVTTEQLDDILNIQEPVDREDWLRRVVRWLETGTILFDHSGRLRECKRKIQAGRWIKPMNDDGATGWGRINYNLAQSKRLLTSEDPVYLIAADLRLSLYGPPDLFFHYFDIRNIPWEGEKAAVRYLMAHDPAYLELFRRLIAEPDRARRFELYEELASLTVAPVGELWQEGVTALGLTSQVSLEQAEGTLNSWEILVAADP